VPDSNGREMSGWAFLVKLVIALCWGLLTEAAVFGIGMAYGTLSYTGPRDGWTVFVTFVSAYIAALVGLPFSLSVFLWRLWRMLPD
jgi:hypothetical protein